ncbi:MAG TPA: class A beta-lactamase-related serine hydrolase [Candidatus Portnoybacteria bacterium]|nr:class A beta-lactamase-related serine hydrolase [Candidatus Portnoybacteria bacterium]
MKMIFFKIKKFILEKPFLAIMFFSLLFFLLGGGIIYLLNRDNRGDISQNNKPERQKNAQYRFTSPLLDCNYEGGPFAIKNDEMKEKIKEIIEESVKSGRANHVSVYFRDLNNGPTMGINDDDEMFSPASLLKVPLMIAYFKKAESDPEILKERIICDSSGDVENITQDFKPELQLEAGQEYAVEDLIKRMIIYSDNQSATLLLNKIDYNFLASVYTDLGVEVPTAQKLENYMTVKEYAAFIRILYNSSYLSRTMSEKALEILSESKYGEGLRAGIPKNIVLANKFGERVFENVFQLHDCGIIYHPKSPYILCLMSKGSDFKKLEGVLKNISESVYEEVNGNE